MVDPSNIMIDILQPVVYRVKKIGKEYKLLFDKVKFDLPTKLYGNLDKYYNKIMDRYDKRKTGVNVLLHGLKGTGKSTLMSMLANGMLRRNIPVIIISDTYTDDAFYEFIAKLGEVCIIIDEFTVLYPRQAQAKLLSLLDGTDKKKRMFILTTNNLEQINNNAINRPSRVYYLIPFTGLDKDILFNLIDEKVNSEDIKNYLKFALQHRTDITWDIILSLIEEINNYNTLEELIDDLSIMNINIDEVIELQFTTSPNVVIDTVYKDTDTQYRVYIPPVFKAVPSDTTGNESYRIFLKIRFKTAPMIPDDKGNMVVDKKRLSMSPITNRYVYVTENYAKIDVGADAFIEITTNKKSIYDMYKSGVDLVIDPTFIDND